MGLSRTASLLAVVVGSLLHPCFAGAGSGGCTVTPSPFWGSTIDFPDDPFRVQGTSESNPNWLKFAILLCDPTKVYFQDSVAYPFHYDFAAERLDPFVGMSLAEFNQISLYEGQQVVLGTVIMPFWTGQPADPSIPEYGIQFVREDPYPPQTVVDLFNLVRSKVNAGPGVQAFYFPTFAQTASAQANQAFLAAQGIEVSSPARWLTGNACYSEGWALGTLKYFPSGEIATAYQSGNLTPFDILLTDGVPAEIPFVAGVASLSPSTPNSHVAILANTFDSPFVHLALTRDAQRALSLVGRRVALLAYERTFPFEECDVRIIEAGALTQQQVDQILSLKELPPLNIAAMAPFGAYSAPTDGLQPSDIQFFGGKAANFGFLRRAIPDRSPVATAFSFDLWNGFLDQTLAGGNTLRQEIGARLSGHTWPPDFAALAADLANVRDLFRDEQVTSFNPTLQAAIIATLQDPLYGFDPTENIRFRSSSNAEDGEQFTGAGLYDSRSGCLADDIDGDQAGPSRCDPTESEERGVFRAIRRVFASFYFDNAFFERLRWSVNESQVGMALLVHHSVPDDIELANGVATVERRASGFTALTFVSQAGAVPVTNPVGGSIPEEVTALGCGSGCVYQITLVRPSNLVQVGATVMEWQADYQALGQLLLAVSDQYMGETGNTDFLLDFEYKKVAPGGAALPAGGLVVKQVRRVPQPDDTPSITPFLINDPTEYCAYPAFGAAVGHANASHRLKSRWLIETRNLWVTTGNLSQSIFADVGLTLTDGCDVYSLEGSPAQWPGASYGFDGSGTSDSWVLSDLGNPRTYALRTGSIELLVPRSQSPLLTIRDLAAQGDIGAAGYQCLEVQVDYANPVPVFACDFGPCGPMQRSTESAFLCPCKEQELGDFVDGRTIQGASSVMVASEFVWRYSPFLEMDGAVFPLVRWIETTITGLVSEPIVLHDEFAQTYHPDPHGIGDHFIFEPRLDPDVPQHQLDELEANDIVTIYAYGSLYDPNPVIATYGADGSCTVDGNDAAVFEDCVAGPEVPPQPTPPRTPEVCRMLFDQDGDQDVDCDDWVAFALRWSGPEPLPSLAQCPFTTAPGSVPATVRVGRSVDSPGNLVMAWGPSCSSGAADYAIYQGALGNWYSHSRADCSDDGGDFTEEITPAAGDRYYLVVPYHANAEGSYGVATAGERPAGGPACIAAQEVGPCP